MGKTSRRSFECLCNIESCLVRRIAVLRQIFILKGSSVEAAGAHHIEAVAAEGRFCRSDVPGSWSSVGSRGAAAGARREAPAGHGLLGLAQGLLGLAQGLPRAVPAPPLAAEELSGWLRDLDSWPSERGSELMTPAAPRPPGSHRSQHDTSSQEIGTVLPFVGCFTHGFHESTRP